MAMTLQEAIDFARNPGFGTGFGIDVDITISMHDETGNVLVGHAYGRDAMFRPDVPLLNRALPTLVGGGAPPPPVHRPSSGGQVPGFSTRGLGPTDAVANLGTIPIDFSVRRDPGNLWLGLLGRGPSVQLEIETLSAPAPAGTVTGGIKLEAAEDGALLRAVGPSLKDPANKASYTVTIFAHFHPG
jgi:hypothetical protein